MRDHVASLNRYAAKITEACHKSAKNVIPITKPRSESGRIPGWTEFVAPLRAQSIFWHKLWCDNGRPHSGLVADIMRKTRVRYHAGIRQLRKHEAEIVNKRIASALSENNSRDFWLEIKCIKQNRSAVSGVVDGLCDSSDIANLFASKFQDLYTQVSYDCNDMQNIRDELDELVLNGSPLLRSLISPNETSCAINSLKRGKSEGSSSLSTDHFINACDKLSVHLSILFSAMLVHGYAPSAMSKSTVIPIPKGRHANITVSCNY